MLILGIETSCDETGVAIVRIEGGEIRLVADTLFSQSELHSRYGGVVPELASRDHIRRLPALVDQALIEAGQRVNALTHVAFARGPGLAGALLVGAGFATALAASISVPVLAMHHLECHLLAPYLSPLPPTFPFVALLVSGGHTQLLEVLEVGEYRLLGDTIDDAAGEAFDKSAKLLGLGYPGGPALSRLAESGSSTKYALPRPLMHRNSLEFSFAGLKTAVRTQALKLTRPACEQARADLAAATQEAIVDVLVFKSIDALKQTGLRRLVVAGGVSANARLRERLSAECKQRRIRVHYPEPALCTDNGAMVALAAAMRLQRGIAETSMAYAFDVLPRWLLSESQPASHLH